MNVSLTLLPFGLICVHAFQL